MKREEQTHPQDDKFEPIELGSVSEETKGGIFPGSEVDLTQNSRDSA
ncbi:hypothetical protein AB6B38_14255 (plasmid) [Glycocaulis abyssi]|uniref:Benenodin family lasso peptide n=1 Tax=Glycocaulis abyssi TaxID=1433403 RepID=A0ABV9NFQ5_9PROT